MEMKHTNIHMNRVSYRNSYRLTVSDDVNVSDNKPDVLQIIWKTGEVLVSEKKPVNGKLYLRGSIPYSVLYLSEGEAHEIQCVRGELLFEEAVDIPTGGSTENFFVRAELEEFEAGVIHSRKLSLRAILGVMVVLEELCDVPAASDLSGQERVHTRTRDLRLSALVAVKRDTVRLREEIFLPSGKESIRELLFYDVKLKNAETRARDGMVEIKGELSIFVLYKKEDGGIEFFETGIPFRNELPVSGCMDNLIEVSILRLTKEMVSCKPDEDGEDRLLLTEAVLEAEVKLYEERELSLLSDLYATDCFLEPVFDTVSFENLLMKNDSRLRVSERVKMPDTLPELLWLCRGNVEIKPELCTREGETLHLSGNLAVDVLYVTAEDERMLQSFHMELPFKHSIEIRGLTQQSTYDIHCNVADSMFQTARNGELELKAELAFLVIAMETCNEKVISDAVRTEFDENRLEELPSMVGYPVKPFESLWDIAKRNCTDENQILLLTEHSGEVHEGDMLLIVKPVSE